MPSNRTSNDIDFVPPTQKAKQPPPKPWPLPTFEPLRVEDYDSYDLDLIDPIGQALSITCGRIYCCGG